MNFKLHLNLIILLILSSLITVSSQTLTTEFIRYCIVRDSNNSQIPGFRLLAANNLLELLPNQDLTTVSGCTQSCMFVGSLYGNNPCITGYVSLIPNTIPVCEATLASGYSYFQCDDYTSAYWVGINNIGSYVFLGYFFQNLPTDLPYSYYNRFSSAISSYQQDGLMQPMNLLAQSFYYPSYCCPNANIFNLQIFGLADLPTVTSTSPILTSSSNEILSTQTYIIDNLLSDVFFLVNLADVIQTQSTTSYQVSNTQSTTNSNTHGWSLTEKASGFGVSFSASESASFTNTNEDTSSTQQQTVQQLTITNTIGSTFNCSPNTYCKVSFNSGVTTNNWILSLNINNIPFNFQYQQINTGPLGYRVQTCMIQC